MAASADQTRAALRAVLSNLASKAVLDWEKAAEQSVDGLLSHVPAGPRRVLWAAQLEALASHLCQRLVNGLTQMFAESVEEAFTDISQINHGLTSDEVDPIKITKSLLQRLGQFVSATAVMKHLENVALPGATTELAAFAQRPTRLEPFLAGSLLDWDDTFQECAALVQAADHLAASVQSMGLSGLLDVLMNPLLAQRNKAHAALKVAPAQTADLIDHQLSGSFTKSEAEQKQLIVNLCGTPQAEAQECLLNLQGGLVQMSPLTAGFATLSTLGPAAVKTCTALKVSYGRPWLVCLGNLDLDEQQRLVKHHTVKEIEKAVKKRLGPAPTLDLLSKVVGVLTWQNKPWDTVCNAINTFGYTQISLPPSLEAIAWQPLHDLWVPVALQAKGPAGVETDQKCLKHICQELGVAPSKAKAGAYFAELGSACHDAVQAWRSQKKPAELDVPQIVKTVGTWHITVRSLFGRPQVFHVDSGYQKSPWVTQPN